MGKHHPAHNDWASEVAEAREPDLPNEGSHPERVTSLCAAEAVERLRDGNEQYMLAQHNTSDISKKLVRHLFKRGQAPFACVVACSDSRVVPEHIFMTGLGELFCIRVAGNVVGQMELASCLYAADHLHTKLILLLGHTHCGAVEAGMEHAEALREAAGVATESNAVQDEDESVAGIVPLVEKVAAAIGDERDPYRAAVLNVAAGLATLTSDPDIARLIQDGGVEVRGAIYHTHSGAVEFL